MNEGELPSGTESEPSLFINERNDPLSEIPPPVSDVIISVAIIPTSPLHTVTDNIYAFLCAERAYIASKIEKNAIIYKKFIKKDIKTVA